MKGPPKQEGMREIDVRNGNEIVCGCCGANYESKGRLERRSEFDCCHLQVLGSRVLRTGSW